MSLSKPFPILKLPLIPLKYVVDELEPVQLVEESFRSSIFKRSLAAIKIPLTSIEWNNSSPVVKNIKLRFNGTQLDIDIAVSTQKGPVKAIINGKFYDFCKFDGRFLFRVTKEDTMKLFEEITEHLWSICKTSYATTSAIIHYYGDIRNCFVFKYSRKFFNFNLICPQDTLKVTPNEIKWFLETLEFTNLTINCPTTQNFKYPGRIKAAKLTLEDSSWVTEQSVLELGCPIIHCNAGTLHLNTILKNWMKMEGDVLEKFYYIGGSDESRETHFEGLNERISVFRREDIRLRAYSQCLEWFDIQRPTDDRMATLIPREIDDFRNFEILAWIPDKNMKYCCRETKERFGIPYKRS